VNDGKAALEAAARTNPDLIVLDVTMPGVDGFQVARELKRKRSSSRVAFLTGHEDDTYIAEGLDAGAMAYVVKRRMQSDLIPALNLARAGQFFISPHAFAGTQSVGTNHHVLVWYSNEDDFFQEISELAYAALLKGDRVFMFLSQKGLGVVGTNLKARGRDLTKDVLFGRYRSFGVENVFPVLMRDGSLDARSIRAFFGHSLRQAAVSAEKEGSRVSVFSDLTTSLVRRGYPADLAVTLEEVWSAVVRQYPCLLYCGCSVESLASRKAREILAGICGEHCNVIPLHG
jgi:CheY-like chemotaxis protein